MEHYPLLPNHRRRNAEDPVVLHERPACGWSEAELATLASLSWVRTLDHHDRLASTNDRALALAEDPTVSLPAVILADQQTAGRGRGTHRWWSAPGALTATLLYDSADLGLTDQHRSAVSLTVGVAICEALLQLVPGLEVGLKWPNDVCARDKKVGGILVEIPHGDRRKVVVGVGLNVNNPVRQAPDPLPHQAASLQELAGFSFNLATVLHQVLRLVHEHLLLLTRNELDLQQRWQTLCQLTGREVLVQVGPRQLRGVCQGIDERGALVIETGHGTEHCLSGSVSAIAE